MQAQAVGLAEVGPSGWVPRLHVVGANGDLDSNLHMAVCRSDIALVLDRSMRTTCISYSGAHLQIASLACAGLGPSCDHSGDISIQCEPPPREFVNSAIPLTRASLL